ncbi:MAG: alcohol dehydrogenase catalytic domain-containing protein, partial [Candidatus Dormibacteraeota bacterium]|nr:alcohol dehydrogenase catalytic domain-containing protein [Candidatus Dormibacteraeota bacterium]
MRALTFQGPRTVRVDELPRPSLQGPDDALVKVSTTAICGSDLHLYHERIPIQAGAVLGHEFAGTIVEIGENVRRFKPGDRVVACFFSFCGHCVNCRRGWFSQCEVKGVFGYGQSFGNLGGGQAEYCLVPHANHTLELIPEAVSDEQALFVGDILATGYFGADRARIRPGDTVAVVGAGPVGLMAVMSAQLFGASQVYAIDMVPDRLALATELGAIPVNPAEGNAAKQVKALTRGQGTDCSIECVGLSATIETAIYSVRPGGTVSVVGVPETLEGNFPFTRVWWNNLTYTGGVCNVPAYMRQ